MLYGKSYLKLQLDFAKILETKLNIPLIEAIYKYTNVFLITTRDFSFNIENPVWKNFANNFVDDLDYVYDKYKGSEGLVMEAPSDRKTFGCFSYNFDTSNKTVKMHFQNNDNSGFGPLTKPRLDIRISELKNMFEDIKKEVPETEFVRGKSWLYNLDYYKSLFPPEFTKSFSEFTNPEWQFMTRWGQFLNSEKEVKSDLAENFLKCVETKSDTTAMQGCLPFKTLITFAPIAVFYKFYSIN